MLATGLATMLAAAIMATLSPQALGEPDVTLQVRTSLVEPSESRAQGQVDSGGIVALHYDELSYIAEHNYLGGTRDIAARQVGETVQIVGSGGTDGFYKVVGKTMMSPERIAEFKKAGPADLYAMTCVGGRGDPRRWMVRLVRTPAPEKPVGLDKAIADSIAVSLPFLDWAALTGEPGADTTAGRDGVELARSASGEPISE